MDKDLPEQSIKLPIELRKELHNLAIKIDNVSGTKNGSTTLYFHLLGIIQQHLKESKKETKAETETQKR
jgi:hypothetical protein